MSVFITGCNRGLGLAFVKHMLNFPLLPGNIFATCRSLEAENAKELWELSDKHSNLHLFEFDVTDVSSQRLPEIVEKVKAVSADSGLSLLINNAGVGANEQLRNVTVESMRRCFDVNAIGPLMITKAFLPLLKQAASTKSSTHSGHPFPVVVNISAILASLHGTSGPQFYLPYRISKTALNMVTKSLSIDLAKFGIISVAVHPGWVQTDMGGKKAPITVKESVSNLVKLIGSLELSKSGCFLNHDGTTIPW